MNYLLLVTAIALSVISAYYSIVGLMAIFAAAAVPIAIMGGTLEFAKIVLATWLKKNWETVPLILKLYFVPSIIVLMLITSAGIFGFLSRAHLEQAVPMSGVMERVALLDEKIKISKENIDANRKALKQMDEAVDQVMARSTSEQGADKAVQIRRSQAKERARLLQEIEAEQKIVAKLNEERIPIAAEVRKIEAEVGPIKYVASLFYDEASNETLEKAVIVLILLFVFTFDPLAVLMFIAFAHSAKTGLIKQPEIVAPPLVKEEIIVPPPVKEEIAEVQPSEKDDFVEMQPSEKDTPQKGTALELSITSNVGIKDSIELTKG